MMNFSNNMISPRFYCGIKVCSSLTSTCIHGKWHMIDILHIGETLDPKKTGSATYPRQMEMPTH